MLKVSRPTLTKWYKQNNFNYVRPNHKISSRYQDALMLELQQEFCAKLIEYWKEPLNELVFIDECSCHEWQKTGKAWVNKHNPFHVALAPTRGKSV